jgi:hypothetical protein
MHMGSRGSVESVYPRTEHAIRCTGAQTKEQASAEGKTRTALKKSHSNTVLSLTWPVSTGGQRKGKHNRRYGKVQSENIGQKGKISEK